MFAASPAPIMEAACGRLHNGGQAGGLWPPPEAARPPLWNPLWVMEMRQT